jgi:hypothetical protein
LESCFPRSKNKYWSAINEGKALVQIEKCKGIFSIIFAKIREKIFIFQKKK